MGGPLYLDRWAITQLFYWSCTRIATNSLRNAGYDAVALQPFPRPDESRNNMQKQEVIDTIIKDMPSPVYDTPWQDIIDLRQEEEFKNKVRLFRQWADTISVDKTAFQINDEVRTAIYEYEKYLKAIGVKYQRSALEIAITASAELLENIVKIRISNIAKMAFSYRDVRAQLTIEEQKAPGRQLSMVYDIKKRIAREA